MAQLTRPKSSLELRAEAAESSLSAIRALVQQWEMEARDAEAMVEECKAKGFSTAALVFRVAAQMLALRIDQLAALCPAPPEDQP